MQRIQIYFKWSQSRGFSKKYFIRYKKDLDGISLNPAYKEESRGQNEYIIRSSLDPVSILKAPRNAIHNVIYPERSKNHNITIPAKTSNPLTEHSIEILDRFSQDKFIGRAGCIPTKKISN
jgi:hypothetical protein